jgi:transcriptional regulator with XRE-family HTH domain
MDRREVKLEEMLKALIERGGFTRNRQAILDQVGVSAGGLSQYTLGKTRPSFEKLVALSDFFGVSLDYLVFGDPISPLVDQGPVHRQVEHAFNAMQTQATQHADLVARVGRVLADRIDEVTREMLDSATAGREGLIEADEILRAERYCRQADIITMSLGSNVIDVDEGDPAAGLFLDVVATNLIKDSRYRFLLAGDAAADDSAVSSFRELLAAHGAGDDELGRCQFRRTTMPVVAGAVLYRLDVTALELEAPALHTQFAKYLDDEGRLGYLNNPNNPDLAAMVMSPAHAQFTRKNFEQLWLQGAIL